MDNPFPVLIVATVVMLVPFVVVSITAFVKISVVLFLVRSALGVQQTPPNLVLYGITIVLTAYVSMPIFQSAYAELSTVGGDLTDPNSWPAAYERAIVPVREFLIKFTEPSDRAFFLQAAEELHSGVDAELSENQLFILAPAFVTAELTRAFEIGVLIYLPFLVIDIVVTNILTALGMMMVSPMVISLPFKLLLFVAADGWTRLTHGLVLSYV